MMMMMFLLVVLGTFLAAPSQAQTWQLIFEENFDGDTLNPEYWQHENSMWGGGNSEFQTYTSAPENSFVANGSLHIRTTLLRDNINPKTGEPFGEDFIQSGVMDLEDMFGYCTDEQNPGTDENCIRTGPEIPPIASARIRSYQKFAFRYGRVEISAKMPVGDWMWPAMWMLPDEWVYGWWPHSGEIDITESIGNRNFYCEDELDFKGIQNMGVTLHWGQAKEDNRWWLTYQTNKNIERNFGDYFHDYVLEWDPQGLRFWSDGELLMVNPGGQLIDEYPEGSCYLGWWEFGKPWIDDASNSWTENYYDYLMAPFDQEFHFIFNVAVGGTNGFIPDDCTNAGGQKPWTNAQNQVDGMWAFYDAEDEWKPTWDAEGDNMNMMIDYVRVYQREEGYTGTQTPDWCPPPPCEQH